MGEDLQCKSETSTSKRRYSIINLLRSSSSLLRHLLQISSNIITTTAQLLCRLFFPCLRIKHLDIAWVLWSFEYNNRDNSGTWNDWKNYKKGRMDTLSHSMMLQCVVRACNWHRPFQLKIHRSEEETRSK